METQKILLIGDEPHILRTLRRNLVGRGYSVSLALDDVETYAIATKSKPDLFVLNLDFTSAPVDGLEICAKLHAMSAAPIIVVSAIGSEDTKIQALDLGADDYLELPFSMDEFLARVRSALRRWSRSQGNGQTTNRLILSRDLLINPDTRQVMLRGDPLKLTPTEYEILLYLAGRAGKVVTHRELLQAVWGSAYGDEREYLRVFISQLRHKIEEEAMHPVYILTEPGVGYRFAADSG
jgi:two-component system KDP operon response regulator KdpE